MHSTNKSAASDRCCACTAIFSILLRTTDFAAEFSGSSTLLHEALPRTVKEKRFEPFSPSDWGTQYLAPAPALCAKGRQQSTSDRKVAERANHQWRVQLPA
jgi:hypothetical protein